MPKLIEEKPNWKLFKCHSLSEAKDILNDLGIEFNCVYENLPLRESIHVYFNHGKYINVAYFTPIMTRVVLSHAGLDQRLYCHEERRHP